MYFFPLQKIELKTFYLQLLLRSTGTPSPGDTADTVVQLSTTPDTKADGGPLWYIKSLLLLSPMSVAGAGKGGPDTDTGLRHPDVPPPPENGKGKLLISVN